MEFYCLTDKGRVRKANEDFVFASDHAVGPLKDLFLVADGMGGEKAGDYASEYTVRKVVDVLRGKTEEELQQDGVVTLLRDAITVANWKLHETAQSDEEKRGMGTTLVAATTIDGRLHVANVGDSRLYILSDSRLRQITLDHSYVQEMVRRGEMTEEMAATHKFKNRITRAIGAESMVRVDFFDADLCGVERILLCSDGLTNMVGDTRIESVLNDGSTPQKQAELLLEEALENGGVDNVTLLIIDPTESEESIC